MKRVAKTYKLDQDLIKRVHAFCDENGIEYSFFIAKAMEEKLIKEINWLEKRKQLEKKKS